MAILLLVVWSAAAVWFFHSRGNLLYYGDAEAHLNIARRIVDSRTPGYDQIGTVWLPLPHALMLPFVRDDGLWRSGLAASIPMGFCFVLAGTFLFGAVRRAFDSTPAAVAAVALFAANPNVMYLQSTAMTEAPFFACLMALLFFSVRWGETQGWGALIGAALAACAGTLTRYEGWFLLPFTTGYFLLAAKRRRLAVVFAFSLIAGLGPLYWLGHNWWLSGDPLGFFRGPYSARTIQGNADYPGHGNWAVAWLQLRTAAALCMGDVLGWMGLAGAVVALLRRSWWAVFLLALPGVFYLWSIHSAGTPIFVPTLWPHSHYNTRYGLTLLPLVVFGAAALVTVAPPRGRALLAALVVMAGGLHWLLHPRPDNWITWKESKVNSDARREWTRQSAEHLAPLYVPGTGIVTLFGDLSGILRTAGIPLREAFTWDNGLPFDALLQRPSRHLREQWVVVMGGDALQTALWKDPWWVMHYHLERTIVVNGAQVIQIYRR